MFSAANNENFNKIKVLFYYVQVCSHNDNYMVQIFPPRQLLSHDQSMNHPYIILIHFPSNINYFFGMFAHG